MKPLQHYAQAKAIVQLVLPHAWVARLNELATARGVNRSALIREAIAHVYCVEVAGDGDDQPGRIETSVVAS